MGRQDSATDKLRAHSAEFRKAIIRIGERVVVAVGYAASNVSMLIGDDGLVIIDTTESTAAAHNILAEFRRITDLPVRAIVYTHGHRDHIGGASVFAAGADPEIIARANLDSALLDTGRERPAPREMPGLAGLDAPPGADDGNHQRGRSRAIDNRPVPSLPSGDTRKM